MANPDRLFLSVGVNYLFSMDQIFALTDSRGRLSLQGEPKLPYEKEPLRALFIFVYSF